MSVGLYESIGVAALAVYGATPVFLLIILHQWYRELRDPRIDLDFGNIEKWRLPVAVPMLVWGSWYPPYIFGVRLVFGPAELLFGAYGLMGCPTTMVALSPLFLKYPAGNRLLFHVLTAYAVMVGAAMVALLYVPDIPFFFLGLASLALIVKTMVLGRLRGLGGTALPEGRSVIPPRDDRAAGGHERSISVKTSGTKSSSTNLSRKDRMLLFLEHEGNRRLRGLGTALYRLTGGRFTPRDRDVVLLTTRGRKSGREHTVLVQGFRDGASLVIAAVNAGRSSNPDWFRNLETTPEATVDLKGKTFRVRAEHLPAEEAAVW